MLSDPMLKKKLYLNFQVFIVLWYFFSELASLKYKNNIGKINRN